MRQRRTICILSTAVLVSTLLWAAPAGGQERTVTVTPSVDLDGGQLVELSGTGWTPDTVIGWCQGVEPDPGEPLGQGLCHLGAGGGPYPTSDSLGEFNTTVRVHRWIYPPTRGSWVDCADPGSACGFGAAEVDIVGETVTGSGPVGFATPPDPPATLGAIPFVPAAGVSPGDEVTVTGSGFSADAVVELYQCLPGTIHPSTCNGGPQTVVEADASGAFTTGFIVEQFVEPPGSATATDCVPSGCVLAAAEAVDFVGTVVETAMPVRPVPPTIVPGIGTLDEGDSGMSTLEVPVTLSGTFDDDVTVMYDTVHIGAGSPIEADPADDYDAASGSLVIPTGDVDGIVEITVHGDVFFEPDELFIVLFHSPTNAVVGGLYGLGFGLIVNDDPAPVIVPGTIEVVEGAGGSADALVPVSLTSASTSTVTVEWDTAELVGTPLGATEGVDYEFGSGTVTFLPGEMDKTVPVTINGDTDVETDELVVVSFHDPVGAPLGGFFGLGFVAILDDDSGGPPP